MTKYIRTKEHIYKRLFIDKAIINELGTGACDKDLNPIGEQIIKESNNIYDLIQDGDLCKLTCRLWFRTVIAEIKVQRRENHLGFSVPGVEFGIENILAWWIPLSNGDYRKVAELNDKGELELLCQ